jgi:non-ribosomal peptide synthetase component F
VAPALAGDDRLRPSGVASELSRPHSRDESGPAARGSGDQFATSRVRSPIACHPDAVSHVTTGDLGVGSWVERRARMTPDHPALVFGARSVGYAELAERIRRLANGLRRLGVRRGDRVAWLGPNHAAFLESLFAVGQLGAVLAPVNHRLGPEERTFVLALTEAVVLIQHVAVEPLAAASVRHRIAVAGVLEGMQDYEALVAASPDDSIAEPVGFGDLLLLPHTSGTTGKPKAVKLTHGNLTWNAVNLLTAADFRRDDVTIAIAPLRARASCRFPWRYMRRQDRRGSDPEAELYSWYENSDLGSRRPVRPGRPSRPTLAEVAQRALQCGAPGIRRPARARRSDGRTRPRHR